MYLGALLDLSIVFDLKHCWLSYDNVLLFLHFVYQTLLYESDITDNNFKIFITIVKVYYLLIKY
jgi:hypothetical protein